MNSRSVDLSIILSKYRTNKPFLVIFPYHSTAVGRPVGTIEAKGIRVAVGAHVAWAYVRTLLGETVRDLV